MQPIDFVEPVNFVVLSKEELALRVLAGEDMENCYEDEYEEESK
jgi:hypothetical protein